MRMMSRDERTKWEETRARGFRRFLWLHGFLGWGVTTGVLWWVTMTFSPTATAPLTVARHDPPHLLVGGSGLECLDLAALREAIRSAAPLRTAIASARAIVFVSDLTSGDAPIALIPTRRTLSRNGEA
jgi:hypothetical protein